MGIKAIVHRGLRYIIKGVPVYNIHIDVKEMPETNILKGRRVLITGGSSGIGFYIARRCQMDGAEVLIVGRREDKLKKASKELNGCPYLVQDVSNVADLPNMICRAENMFGREGKIDSLVSNAGISLHEHGFHHVTEDTWDRQMSINLKGNYFMVKCFIEYLESKEDKTGNILVITSDRAKRSDDIPYGLTKAASNSFIQGIARKIIEEGIRLNGLGPGVTCSELTSYSRDENMYFEIAPQKRLFLPEEMANVASFLLSDASACISGEIITCDQGMYITHW